MIVGTFIYNQNNSHEIKKKPLISYNEFTHVIRIHIVDKLLERVSEGNGKVFEYGWKWLLLRDISITMQEKL
jgi:hypothetical protein